MKKLVIFCFMLISCSLWGKDAEVEYFVQPYVSLSFPDGFPATVYSNTTVYIPMLMRYAHLRRLKLWTVEPTTSQIYLQNVSGQCPALSEDHATWHRGECRMNVVLNSGPVGSTHYGEIVYTVTGKKEGQAFNIHFRSPHFSTTVIPPPLSMKEIQQQEATIGQKFKYPLGNSVFNYYESIGANIKVNLNMISKEKAELTDWGLNFDPASFLIQGKPTKVGTFKFFVGASNAYSKAEPTLFTINVGYNLKDKPRFKQKNEVVGALPDKPFKINLFNLLENAAGFNKTNQITFSFDKHWPKLEWLNISPQNPELLEGIPPADLAGRDVEIHVIAHSNTGGDSEPLDIILSVSNDSQLQPVINYFELFKKAGRPFLFDLSEYIQDPANDANLKVIIDKINPEISWLHTSVINLQALEGLVPEKVSGQKYQITLHLNTPTGGDSKLITVPLQIVIDPDQTPRFKFPNPSLPIVYPRQSYQYDFVANREVFPEYEDAPYTIQFDKDYPHPQWLFIENNKLSSSRVPDDIKSSQITLNLIIENIPGGKSKSELTLFVAN